MARVTLQTIADRLGVSRMTVSNAFSRPDQLSDELRRRILVTAEELGYAGPDPAGRALARGTTGAVGVLLTDSLGFAFTDEVATGFLRAAVEELAPTGLALTLLTAEPGGEADPARDVAIDGALVYSCRPESPSRDWLVRRRLPLVFVDQDRVPGIPSVNVDDRAGARAAAQHLVDLGHRRIGIINLAIDGPRGFVDDPLTAPLGHPQRQRALGWLDALDAAGLTPTTLHIEHASEDDVEEAAGLVIALEDRPTAVLCFSDALAVGVMQAAADRGVSVPEDLSVVGFDDSPVARRIRPGLTTVQQDVAAKGRLAAATLIAAIDHGRTGATSRVRHHVLPTRLVVRQSTTHPPVAEG